MENPLFVALDVDHGERALELARQLQGKVGGFKVGPRLLLRHGGEWVKHLARFGLVFIDNKYLDIPNTMAAAVRATFEVGASFTTIHCWAGPEAMCQLAELERELNQQRPFKILAVTILTSFTAQTLPPSLRGTNVTEQVLSLAQEAYDCGLTGVVCSPLEVEALRARQPESFLVTPGVRFCEDDKGDQKRVLAPHEAMCLGSSALVVGRPICDAPDPVLAAERYLEAISRA